MTRSTGGRRAGPAHLDRWGSAWRLATVLIALMLAPRMLLAQDFVSPLDAGPSSSALALIERGLAAPRSGLAIEAGATRWLGLSEWSTRSLALAAGVGSARIGAGISQSGDAALGWQAFGVGLGVSRSNAGFAFRGTARRDRDPGAESSALGPGVGAEAGFGAWIVAASSVIVWTSVPQVWTRGAAPPMQRPLEIGAACRVAGLDLWLARAAPPGSGAWPSSRRAGIGFSDESWALWLDARDHPLRGGLGARVCLARATVAVGIESHPVLGETIHSSLAFALQRGAR